MHPPAPPTVDPSELRPRRRWYVVAGIIGGVLVLAGIGGFVYGVFSAASSGGLTKRFGPGETVTVRLAPQSRPAIYVAESGPAGGVDTECTATSTTGDSINLSSPSYSFVYTREGTTWQLRYLIDVAAAGEYRVSCRPSAGDVAAMAAIGEAPRMGSFFTGLLGGLASLFALPIIGVLIGATTAVVVGVRRGDHRRRLQAERAGFRPHPPPGPPNPPSPR